MLQAMGGSLKLEELGDGSWRLQQSEIGRADRFIIPKRQGV